MKKVFIIFLLILLVFSGCMKRDDLTYIGESHYGITKNQKDIYYENYEPSTGYHYSKLKTVDIASFEILNSSFSIAKDKNQLYCKDQVIETADFETFEIAVLQPLVGDIDNILVIGKDNDSVYNIEDGCVTKLATYQNINPNSVELVTKNILRDFDTYLYLHGTYTQVELNVDYQSFDSEFANLSNGKWLRDKTQLLVYTGKNESGFTKVSDQQEEITDVQFFPDTPYVRVGQKIYYDAIQLEGADTGTFSILDHSLNYAKDKNYVYSRADKIEGISDSLTYEFLTFAETKTRYARDRDNYYWNDKKLENVDYQSFELVTDSYAKDKNFYYYSDTQITTANFTTFIILDEHFARDDSTYFYQGKPIEEADYNTFSFCGNFEFAEDKNNYYDFGQTKIKVISKVENPENNFT